MGKIALDTHCNTRASRVHHQKNPHNQIIT